MKLPDFGSGAVCDSKGHGFLLGRDLAPASWLGQSEGEVSARKPPPGNAGFKRWRSAIRIFAFMQDWLLCRGYFFSKIDFQDPFSKKCMFYCIAKKMR
ncbi:MAG: hypothetical protein EOM37_15890 [Proteobacteria bacterium]|nr:hypothetical protein [Pseudomonadota bacterium]